MPLYITLLSKYANIRLFHAKTPLYGSVDVNNICNLHCTHCYWRLKRKEEEKDLSAEGDDDSLGGLFSTISSSWVTGTSIVFF
jgi:MoaA/NifB/PqqE/SkfB family radical SAM enzyme